jgi:hypothetical protein
MTAHPSPLSHTLAIYAGQTCLGHVTSLGPRLFEAFDPDDKSIGIFKTQAGAADALEAAYDHGGRYV